MIYKVTLMSGAGNLFSVIDNRENIIDAEYGSKLAPIVCSKQYNSEFDTEGLMLLEKSKDKDFKCNYYNPDGSTGMMCGNGGRAIVKYAQNKGELEKANGINFEMAGSIYTAKLVDENIDLEMAEVNEIKAIEIKLQGRLVKAIYVDNGSQHCAVNIKNLDLLDIDRLDINGIGREVRYNEIFGKVGSNANFYDIRNGIVYLRTYERGVEKETGACGTGAVATAIAVATESKLDYPIEIIPTSGEKLIIDKDENAKYHLIGPAVIIKEIEIEV